MIDMKNTTNDNQSKETNENLSFYLLLTLIVLVILTMRIVQVMMRKTNN